MSCRRKLRYGWRRIKSSLGGFQLRHAIFFLLARRATPCCPREVFAFIMLTWLSARHDHHHRKSALPMWFALVSYGLGPPLIKLFRTPEGLTHVDRPILRLAPRLWRTHCRRSKTPTSEAPFDGMMITGWPDRLCVAGLLPDAVLHAGRDDLCYTKERRFAGQRSPLQDVPTGR